MIEVQNTSKTAVIFGATGLIGGFLLDRLLNGNIYTKVISIGRRKLKMESPKLRQLVIDMNNYQKYDQLVKGDDLFICLGTTIKTAGSKEAFRKIDYQYVVEIAKAGFKNGINQISVVSSIGADSTSSNFYIKTKGEMEDVISKIPFWSTQLFRPSLLLGERREYRNGEEIAKFFMNNLGFLMAGPLKKYKPNHADHVAKAMYLESQRLQEGVRILKSTDIRKMASSTALKPK